MTNPLPPGRAQRPARMKKSYITINGRTIPKGHRGFVSSRQLTLSSGEEMLWFKSTQVATWLPESFLEVEEA